MLFEQSILFIEWVILVRIQEQLLKIMVLWLKSFLMIVFVHYSRQTYVPVLQFLLKLACSSQLVRTILNTLPAKEMSTPCLLWFENSK